MKRTIFTFTALLVFASIVLSACVPSTPWTRQRYVNNLQKKYQQAVLDYFDNNEQTLNKLVGFFFDNNNAAIRDAYSVYLSKGDSKDIGSQYVLDIYSDWAKKTDSTDFNYEQYSITSSEMDSVLPISSADRLYNRNTKSSLGNCYSLSYQYQESIMCWFDASVEVILVYSRAGNTVSPPFPEGANKEYWINDHWYIQYLWKSSQ